MEDDFNAQFYPEVTDYSDDDAVYPYEYWEWRKDVHDEDEDDCGDVSGCEPYDEEF